MGPGGAGVTHSHAGDGEMIPLPACGALYRALTPSPGFPTGGADVLRAWVCFDVAR